MELQGKRVVLRRPRLDDADSRCRGFADPEVTRHLPLAGRAALPRADVEVYLRAVMAADRPVLDFSIDLIDGRTIGSCSLRDFDAAGRAELSLILGERWARGHGYGREAMGLLIEHGFRDLCLHCIWLVVRADNSRAIRLYEGLGFRHDGVLRAAALIDGVHYDKLIMSILAGEWQGRRSDAAGSARLVRLGRRPKSAAGSAPAAADGTAGTDSGGVRRPGHE